METKTNTKAAILAGVDHLQQQFEGVNGFAPLATQVESCYVVALENLLKDEDMLGMISGAMFDYVEHCGATTPNGEPLGPDADSIEGARERILNRPEVRDAWDFKDIVDGVCEGVRLAPLSYEDMFWAFSNALLKAPEMY